MTTDAELVASARGGSEAAFGEIVHRYQRPVLSLLLRMLRDAALAEDLTQETFVRAWRALATYDPTRRFASWLFKIAHNAAIDPLRRRQPAVLALQVESDGRLDLLDTLAAAVETPAEAVSRRDLASALEGALAALRPEYRAVILLRFREGLAYEDLAEVLELPLGTVKTHIHRARKEMAAWLQARGYGRGSPGGPAGGETRRRRDS